MYDDVCAAKIEKKNDTNRKRQQYLIYKYTY